MSTDSVDETVVVSLQRSVLDRLREACPCGVTQESETESFERAVVALLGQRYGRMNSDTSSRDDASVPPTPTLARRPSMPELTPGPEGIYSRDVATGRWRSLSRDVGVRSKPNLLAQENEVTDSQESRDKQLDEPIAPVSDPVAAQAEVEKARAETAKLWEAFQIIAPPKISTDLRQRYDIDRAQLELEFEKQRKDASWEMIRNSVDMKTFAMITRRATGCEGERNLAVVAGRNLFEGASKPKEPQKQRRPRSSASIRNLEAPVESSQTDWQMKQRRPSGAGVLPPRPKLHASHTFPEANTEKIPTTTTTRPESPSVRHRVLAFEGAGGGA